MTPDESKSLSTTALRFITTSRAQWGDLVLLGAALTPKQLTNGAKRLAEQTGTSAQTIHRKFLAIKHGINSGLTVDKLIEQGQKATLAGYVNGKVKARSAPLVQFPHRLTPEVRDGVKELCLRIGRVCHLKTFDEVFEFILATYADLPDEELIHLAGESHASSNGHKAR